MATRPNRASRDGPGAASGISAGVLPPGISQATLVLSTHRPETVPLAKTLMADHDTVILEEPPDPGFTSMLSGRLEIDAYLQELDLEFPAYSRLMCEALRVLQHKGIRIVQVEPFIDTLLKIHEFFADGGKPSDLPQNTTLHRVYEVERKATAALLNFYSVSVRGTFDACIEAVKRFARADAQRFALRDQLRTEAIIEIIAAPGRHFIEAGQIHYPLWRELKSRLPRGYRLRVCFLMAAILRTLGLKGHLYGPGDLLTLLYRFHPHRGFDEEDILAARALVFIKLIAKEEIEETSDPVPHCRDELEIGAITRALSMADCRRLFGLIRKKSTPDAREIVLRMVGAKSKP